MDDFIRSSVASVEAFFQGRRIIQLPWFQRAYAWREENVQRLISDVQAAMKGAKQRYSLGNIYLAGPVDGETVALVDGHQRAITLVMMFAVLRDLVADDPTLDDVERDLLPRRLHNFLRLNPHEETLPPVWRLAAKPQMAPFFEKFVLAPGATLVQPTDDLAALTPAERNLVNNRDRMRIEFAADKLQPAERRAFIEFLLTRCRFVVIEIGDEDEAWSMLGVEQTTRLPHDASEQAKITIIYSMQAAQQEEASRIWENVQAQLGSERVTELLGHLRTQRITKRSSKPLEGELQQLYSLNQDGLDFMRSVFLLQADAMGRIDARQVGAGVLASVIQAHIELLSWLDHRLWMAPALAWLTSKGDLHRETEHFFARLERLAWMLRLASTDPNEQENRFIALTSAVRRNTSIDEWRELEIAPKTIAEALAILRSRTFYFKHMSKNVLRRLCFLLGNDPGFIDGDRITVEHVLPRNPPGGRQWLDDFGSMTSVRNHADRLGNLVILPGKLNREAGTNDWPIKRAILKRCSESERPKFRLAADAATHSHWTQDVISARTEKMIGVLFSHWQLPVTPM